MTPSCPSCQAPFTPGAETCARCGASLLVAPSFGGADPVCAVHPEWRSVATCQRCGAFACARCLRQGPEGAICATCHEREPLAPLPWDQRSELGLFKAFWRTCFGMLVRPADIVRGVNPDGSVGSSLGFALLTAIVGFVPTCLAYLVLLGAAMSFLPGLNSGASGTDPKAVRLWAVGFMAVWTVLVPLFATGITLVNAGLDHLILRMGGVTRGFSVTLRAYALSQAPYIAGVIPFVALYAAPFWATGLRLYTYRTLHRTSWGTAVAGALALPVLSTCLCCGGYAAFMFFAFKSAGKV
ncbi:YIP1 family protein [Corallococcus sp. EGB]|uniref:YIP1 family protein n=1 Tax=Corallococcus sp. EGB TaxID=1521117 RepID=UPI001CBD1617|nr:YIP1 family protein [Corallococcus sp. EGB]